MNHIWKVLEEKRPMVVSGPCSAETEEQVLATCKQLADTGQVDLLRAGIWKPRTRPGSFEGVGVKGLKWMTRARKETGLPISIEVANGKHVYEALKHQVDVLWIGARTTVNPFAVQEVADALEGVDVPVLVKNPVNPDVDLWVGAIERIERAGITRLGAVHRGFSQFVPSRFRNEPKWQIPIELRRRLPGLPIICDPSHICGNREMLLEISQRAMDLNFQGLMIESHITPEQALSDSKQQVTPKGLVEILDALIIRDAEEDPEGLTGLRDQIDHLDQELLHLFSKRMEVAEAIGAFKKNADLTILQDGRWNEIVERTLAQSAALGLSSEFLKKILMAVHQESINHQNKVMNELGVKSGG